MLSALVLFQEEERDIERFGLGGRKYIHKPLTRR
jgi:hypothetical protein